ncbi:MAG: hypothetical protein OHK0038_02760 [Flammeovirgaceae bacterium]
MARTTKGRVNIPINVEENLDLAKKVFDKHKADGDSSLLNNLQDYDWNKIGENISICLAKHLEAEEYRRKMEGAYRERDLYLPEINEALRASKSLLKAAFSKNPKKLGDWGFSVDDTPKVKKTTNE